MKFLEFLPPAFSIRTPDCRPGKTALNPSAGWHFFLLGGLIFLRFLAPPIDALPSSLDPSWQAALIHAFERQWHFGSDLIFTYGPLGSFLQPANYGNMLYSRYLLHGILGLVVAISIIRALRLTSTPRQSLAFVAVLYLLPFGDIAFFPFGGIELVTLALLCSVVCLLKNSKPSPLSLDLLFFSLLTTIGLLSKFTIGLIGMVSAAIIVLVFIYQRKWGEIATLILANTALLFLGWEILGQSSRALGAYFYGCVEIVSGYSTMAIQELPFWETRFALALTLLLFASLTTWLISHLKTHNRFAKALPELGFYLILMALAFLCWKHGFMRCDREHVSVFYLSMLLFPLFIFAYDGMRISRLTALFLSLLTLFATQRLLIHHPADFQNLIAQRLTHTSQAIEGLMHPAWLLDTAKDSQRPVLEEAKWEHLKAVVGREETDAFGNNQLQILFSKVNYAPRPIFQSYSAYTPDLIRLNQAYYQSKNAPRYVFMDMAPIDGRITGLADSLVYREILLNYSYVQSFGPFPLLKKTSNLKAVENGIVSAQAVFGERIAIPASPSKMLWLTTQHKKSLVASAVEFSYKLPQAHMILYYADGSHHSYRYLPSLGETGFAIKPYIKDLEAMDRYYSQGESPGVPVAFSIDSEGFGYARNYSYSIAEITPQEK